MFFSKQLQKLWSAQPLLLMQQQTFLLSYAGGDFQYDIGLIRTKEYIPRARMIPLCRRRYRSKRVTMGVCGMGSTIMDRYEFSSPSVLMETVLHEK